VPLHREVVKSQFNEREMLAGDNGISDALAHKGTPEEERIEKRETLQDIQVPDARTIYKS
jgi:hypothetical protein